VAPGVVTADRPGGLLLVHAHPDDETIATGGTIAHYCRRGVPVAIVRDRAAAACR
jgi:N-acetyl-1-D-myo-inositol-2-amino-2-deoxy-alpha-D-glucopyranoside deacetylase